MCNYKKILCLLIIALSTLVQPASLLAAAQSVEGTVKDASTGEALFGATVVLEGTSLGATTDPDGRYLLKNVPPGTYSLRVTYIGYVEIKRQISVMEGQALMRENFSMQPVTLEGKEVLVTAQAVGQKQAINQQLSSNQIMSAVSAARMQELPDANAAESVGRLPGMAVLRSGGEGNQVVVRGLAPKYNSVTIDGVQMSSSGQNDRSADLSMISSNMLEGIQVTKSVTADMDADVLGGSINFQIREARTEIPGRAQFNLLMQGGYNNLSDAINKYNNYKYVFSAENRFLEEKLGVFGQLDVERKNLTSNEMGAAYDKLGSSTTEYITNGVNLFYIPRDRMRYNGALVLDYKLPEGKIKLANFLSTGSTDTKSRQENFDIALNQHSYTFTSRNSKLSTITNTIEYSDQLPVFRLNTKLSHTFSETKTPNEWLASFKQSSSGLNGFVNKPDLDPKTIVRAANNKVENTYLSNFSTINTYAKERALNGSLDLETDFNVSDFISSVIKFGGKVRYQERSYKYNVYNSKGGEGGLELLSATVVDSLIAAELGLPGNLGTSIPITYFTDPSFSYGTFMGGDFTMVNPLDYGKLQRIANLLDRTKDYFAQRNLQIAYGPDNQKSTTNNYEGNEITSAFYLMSVINVGPQLTFIPGVRYQNLRTEYTGVRGVQSSQSYFAYNHYDTTVVQNHGYWLPSVTLRYKPFTWFDLRLSYTNTLAYPDYNAIIPRIDVNLNNRIEFNNYDLKPSRSANYDAYMSFYNNELGLFTIGGFLKQIDDLIFGWTFNVSRGEALKYYPRSLVTNPPSGNATIITYVNNKFRVNNYGAEVDWQTHFWYLPGILSGLVLNVNYTHIFSEAEYPMSFIRVENRITKFVDTSYTARLLFQPNDILNLSVGFDYADFSARLSMLYQANIFTGTNFWPQLRTNTDAYTRWDFTAKQDLPWFGIQIFGELNNINGAQDVSVIQAAAGVPSLKQDYGMTANIGLRIKL